MKNVSQICVNNIPVAQEIELLIHCRLEFQDQGGDCDTLMAIETH